MSFTWDVSNLNNESELMDKYTYEYIYDGWELKIDRRHGEYDGDYKFNWHSGDLISIKGYSRAYHSVNSSGNAMLTGISIKVKKGASICETCNGNITLDDTEALSIINQYKDTIIERFNKALTVTKQYIYEEDAYRTFAYVSLREIEINESRISGEAYAGQGDCNYDMGDDSCYKDPDLWDESDLNEYHGFEPNYEGDYD